MSVRFPLQTPALQAAALLAFVLAVPAFAGGRLADALAGPAARAIGVEAVPTSDGVAFEATADYEAVVTATRLPADEVAFEVTADYEVVVTATPLPADEASDEVAFEATADYEVVVTATSPPS